MSRCRGSAKCEARLDIALCSTNSNKRWYSENSKDRYLGRAQETTREQKRRSASKATHILGNLELLEGVLDVLCHRFDELGLERPAVDERPLESILELNSAV